MSASESSPSEIYCYEDTHSGIELAPLILALEEGGYHVVVGRNLDELKLLLDISPPTAILYTLVTEGATLSASFQSVLDHSRERGVPIILVGPGDPSLGFTLYYPRGGSIEERFIPADWLLEAVAGLREAPPDGEVDTGVQRPFEERYLDVIGDGAEEIQIETRLSSEGTPKITTQVTRHGALLVSEEQRVDVDDPQLTHKMDTQHLLAVNSYSPALSPTFGVTGSKFRGEVSGPIELPPISESSTAVGNMLAGKTKLVVVALFVVAALFAIAALYFAGEPASMLPEASPGAVFDSRRSTGDPAFRSRPRAKSSHGSSSKESD